MKIVEYYLRHVLAEGVADLRAHLDQVDEVFAELACPPLDKTFGRKIIDEIKCFFADNDVPVRSAFGQNPIDLPSLTIHLVSSQEDPQYRAMQDHVAFVRVPKAPTVLLSPFYGLAYDSQTGRLSLPKTLDMSAFLRGRKIFSEEDDAVYTIKGTIKSNDPGTPPLELKDQYVTIVDENGDTPGSIQFARLSLLSSVDFSLKRLAAATFREVFEIRVNAQTNSDQAVWLYYLTAHILMKNKAKFEEVGLESQTFGVSEFQRDVGRMPNNIWGRTIRLTFLVQHTWKEDFEAFELEGVNLNAQSPITGQIVHITEA